MKTREFKKQNGWPSSLASYLDLSPTPRPLSLSSDPSTVCLPGPEGGSGTQLYQLLQWASGSV